MKYLISIATLFFLTPLVAFAHATPISYSPASGEGLSATPQEIVIRFSERLESAASSLVILAPDGTRSRNTDSSVSKHDPYLLRAPVTSRGEGAYTVSWQVVSADDGHFTRGAFSFAVGRGSVASNASSLSIEHGSPTKEAAALWIELLGEYVLIALLVLNVFLVRPLARRLSLLYADVRQRLSRLLTLAGVLASLAVLGSSLAFLLIKAKELSALTGGTLGEATQALMLTNAGEAALIRAGLAIVIGFGFLVFRRSLWEKDHYAAAHGALSFLVLALAYYRAVISHASASHFLPDFSVAVNIVHLFDKGLIVGSLILMVVIILPILSRREELVLAVRPLFSRIYAGGLFLGGASAAYISWLHLKDWSNLNSDWGYRFFILLVFTALLILPRLFQEFFLNPVIAENVQGKRKDALATSRLLFSFEACAGVAVAAISALIIITTPPVYGTSLLFSHEERGGRIELRAHSEDANKLVVVAEGPSGESPHSLTAVAENVEAGIDSLVLDTTPQNDGTYTISRDVFGAPGQWNLSLIASSPDFYDMRAHFSFTTKGLSLLAVPRRFDAFASIFIIAALFIGLLGILLFRNAQSAMLRRSRTSSLIPRFNTDMARYGGLAGVVIFVAILVVVSLPLPLLKGEFRLRCEREGHFWIQSVPQYMGVVTSPIARAGCSVGTGRGMSHFVTRSSYEAFLKPAFPSIDWELPKTLIAGTPTTLRFRIVNEEGEPQEDLTIEHDRLIHTIVVRSDFGSFAHVHPDDAKPLATADVEQASFSIPYTFPTGGRYLIAVDYAVRAKHFSEFLVVEVLGEAPTLQEIPRERQQVFDGYNVTLEGPQIIKAKANGGMALTTLTYRIEKDGKPVTDLHEYLGAPMHIAISSADLRDFSHVHGELPLNPLERLRHTHARNAPHVHKALPVQFGPAIEAHLTFEKPGEYILFGEFMHEGKVIVTRFSITVE